MASFLKAALLVVLIGATRASHVLIDEDAIRKAYEDVRSDNNNINWVLLGYEGKKIRLLQTGSDYDEFLDLLQGDSRNYGYVRFETGDEMNRRAKFAFITWIGPGVKALKKAKVSTDKAFVKEIFSQFAKEVLADEKDDLKYDKVKNILERASGAAYGIGNDPINSW